MCLSTKQRKILVEEIEIDFFIEAAFFLYLFWKVD